MKQTAKTRTLNMIWRRSGKKSIGAASNRIVDLPAFDAYFYRRYYLDLAAMPDDAALAEHFARFGVSEGRFGTSGAMIEALQDEFGRLPWDFRPNAYRAQHSDLVSKTEAWELIEHFLRYGRAEKRAYGADLSAFEREFASWKGSRIGTEPDQAHEQQFATFSAMLEAAGLPPGAWLNRFMLFEFVLLNADWLPRRPASRMDGLTLFLQHGIARYASISLSARFDPAFYRAHGGSDLQNASDIDLYKDWLSRGLEAGVAGSEGEALRQLLGEEQFPTCFDERVYRDKLPRKDQALAPGRLAALSHYIAIGFAQEHQLFTLPQTVEAAALLEAIGERYLANRDLKTAKRAFDAALARTPQSSRLHHRRGDTFALLGQRKDATNDFAAAADLPGSGLWSHIHAADGLAAESATLEAAVDRILRSAPRFHGDPRWRGVAHGVLDKLFAEASINASKLYAAGARETADAHLTAALDRLAEIIPVIDPLPAPLPDPRSGRIVIIANRDLPQCEHYRVEQKRRQLEHGGWTVEVFGQWESAAARPAIDRAAAVIFYRVAAFRPVMHAMLYARALGLPTIYEIDDLLFDPRHYPDPFESFEGQITEHDYVGLQYGVPLFRYAAGLCDIGLVSTPALAEAMRPLVRSRTCHVLRNALDQRNLPFLTRMPEPSGVSTVTVFYGSGTKAHNRDFTELAAPALLNALERYPEMRLVIAGYLRLDPRFAPYAHRLRQLGFTGNTAAYWEVLAGADINIAVLAPTQMTDAKSEIKWLEAAMCGIPSIVSATRTYREILTDGEDAMLALTSEDWARALDALVSDPDLRRRMGASARAHAIAAYGLDEAVETWRGILPPSSPPPAPVDAVGRGWMEQPVEHRSGCARARSGKPRILLVNVYFPPQAVGGATRVVRDNLDHFLDRADDRFEFAVAAIDDNAPVSDNPDAIYDTRIDHYRDVPVYRISAPMERHMIWRPFNPKMRTPFETLLDRFEPDLVHIHCIQRLTGTVVEALQAHAIPYVVSLHDAWWISDFQFLVDDNGQVHTPGPDPFAGANDPEISPADSIARRLGLGRLLDGASALLAVSETFAELYRNAGFPQTRAIPNGAPPLAVPARRPSPTHRVRLGQIGGRTTHKGATLLETVLRTGAFDQLALTIVDHAQVAGFRRDEIWGSTPVTVVGYTPQDQIAALYGELDVLLAPSLWPESFGLVTREARAAGLWVVASDRGAIGEDIVEGVDGYRIDVSGPDDLRRVLATMNAHPDRFRTSPPRPERPWRTMADQGEDLLSLYDQLLRR